MFYKNYGGEKVMITIVSVIKVLYYAAMLIITLIALFK